MSVRRAQTLLATALLLSSACAAPRVERATAGATYANPVVDEDFADPTVLRASDGWYYAYGTQTDRTTASGVDSLNVQVLRSRDLVRWSRLPDALPVKPAWASRTRDFWAPHVAEHAGTYYLYYSAKPDAALADTTRGLCLAVATARSPAGPFTDRGTSLACGRGFENIDPMQFDDPATGTPLLYWGSGFGPIKVQPLAADRVSFAPGSAPTALVAPEQTTDTSRYQRLVEGAWVTYRAPWYYLYYSGDNCCGPRAHYAVMVARSRAATGPFETLAAATGRAQSVILARDAAWIAPGHNSVVRDARGDDWMVYHAVDARRPRGTPTDDVNTRRVMLMDRIVYRDGWPTIEGGRPSSGPRPAPVVP